jgi:hypothetical protein
VIQSNLLLVEEALATPMNAKTLRTIVLAALFSTPTFLSAQDSIDWWTIDGGGGTSTGGVYSVTGTIGQHDAGGMSGGNFTISGGFWAIVAAIQTPGAPLLSITLSNNSVIVS